MSEFTNETVEPNRSELHPNTVLGIIGALVGALLGGAIWVGLYQLGIIAAFAGIAIIYFSCYGFTLLAKGITMKGVIVSIVISILVLLAMHFLCWGLEIFKVFGSEYNINLMDSILAVPDIAFREEFIVEFFKELLIGFVLIAVGASRFIKKAR